CDLNSVKIASSNCFMPDFPSCEVIGQCSRGQKQGAACRSTRRRRKPGARLSVVMHWDCAGVESAFGAVFPGGLCARSMAFQRFSFHGISEPVNISENDHDNLFLVLLEKNHT